MPQDIVVIRSAALSALISALGAELQTLTDARGNELLWNGDPAFWTGRAPILFPIVGEVADGTYRVGDKSYELGRHGFARKRDFIVAEAGESWVTFRLEADEETQKVYPFDFRLDMRFALEGATLAMTATVTNTGAGPLPASFGYHPAFRWPLPYGAPRGDHLIRFAQDEPAPIRRLAGNLLTPEPRPTPVDGRDMALADDLFVEDAVVFDDLRSRRLAYGVPETPGLVVDYPQMPHLGIWTKPGAGYVCIEPWQGHADPDGFSGDIFDKPGIVAIEPGEARDFAMTVRLSDDPFGAV
ncbi:Aldose 1-epimerase [Hartmannibacter diazotrophicus]|uniref:Aldose 1-epimerase n=1 Tax=Hartmannibacter diazotrophicus TaxID=1482074 RepID=A0A2C9DBJ2_9HYPH|nr:aldose 1-epimerase family protein [Hartmannibacter diazotrophicus]SON56975.1 Aldose 1-epimerase [Hartmannibacter diazotrophicus]